MPDPWNNLNTSFQHWQALKTHTAQWTLETTALFVDFYVSISVLLQRGDKNTAGCTHSLWCGKGSTLLNSHSVHFEIPALQELSDFCSCPTIPPSSRSSALVSQLFSIYGAAFSSSAIKINRMSGDDLPDSQVGFLTSHITQSFLTELVILGGPVHGTWVSLSFALGSLRDTGDPSMILVGQSWAGLCLLTRKNRNLQGNIFFLS